MLIAGTALCWTRSTYIYKMFSRQRGELWLPHSCQTLCRLPYSPLPPLRLLHILPVAPTLRLICRILLSLQARPLLPSLTLPSTSLRRLATTFPPHRHLHLRVGPYHPHGLRHLHRTLWSLNNGQGRALICGVVVACVLVDLILTTRRLCKIPLSMSSFT